MGILFRSFRSSDVSAAVRGSVAAAAAAVFALSVITSIRIRV